MAAPTKVRKSGTSANSTMPKAVAQTSLRKSSGISTVMSASLRASVTTIWPSVPITPMKISQTHISSGGVCHTATAGTSVMGIISTVT